MIAMECLEEIIWLVFISLCILSSIKDEISKIRQKFLNKGYPLRFINSVIKQFSDKLNEKSNEEDDYILPPDFFEIKKQVVLIEIIYCEKKKHLLNAFLRNFMNSLIIYMKSK